MFLVFENNIMYGNYFFNSWWQIGISLPARGKYLSRVCVISPSTPLNCHKSAPKASDIIVYLQNRVFIRAIGIIFLVNKILYASLDNIANKRCKKFGSSFRVLFYYHTIVYRQIPLSYKYLLSVIGYKLLIFYLTVIVYTAKSKSLNASFKDVLCRCFIYVD